MQRRNLAKTALAGAAAAAIIPAAAAQAANKAENIVFTENDPGHWAKVEKLHVPVLTITGSSLTVKTPHPMSPAHYIVSHTVVLAGGKFLDRKTFTPADEPVSTHTLPDGYTGKIFVTSTCNLHDFWVKTTSV
jgi:superoxide reductase